MVQVLPSGPMEPRPFGAQPAEGLKQCGSCSRDAPFSQQGAEQEIGLRRGAACQLERPTADFSFDLLCAHASAAARHVPAGREPYRGKRPNYDNSRRKAVAQRRKLLQKAGRRRPCLSHCESGRNPERLKKLALSATCRCQRGDCFKKFDHCTLLEFLQLFWGMGKRQQDVALPAEFGHMSGSSAAAMVGHPMLCPLLQEFGKYACVG